MANIQNICVDTRTDGPQNEENIADQEDQICEYTQKTNNYIIFCLKKSNNVENISFHNEGRKKNENFLFAQRSLNLGLSQLNRSHIEL